MKNRTTPTEIKKLKKSEIFVFGSNKDGNHIGGAAKLALDKFGAEEGISRGFQGKCYAIDTMSGLDVIKSQIEPFISVANVCTDKIFLVTEIGCGIAGFSIEQIAPLFEGAKEVENIHLPESFWNELNKVVIKGFKGFDKDLKCRDFQYEVGNEYVHKGKVLHCSSGFHFCKNPLDIFKYYRFNNGNKFHEVEGWGEVSEDNSDTKVSVSRIKIGVEINLKSIIDNGLKFIFEKVKVTKDKIKSSGNSSTGAASGNSSTGAASGYSSTGAASGYSSTGAASGNSSTGAASGDYSTGAASGYSSTGAASGDYSTGAASGDYSTGAASGNYSTGAASGDYCEATVSGKNSIAVANGIESKAKGSLNTWLVLPEYVKSGNEWNIEDVYVVKVDGKKIKADTLYTVKKGKFIQVK